MTIRIQLNNEENEFRAKQVDLSVDGWVIAEVTASTVTNRRWIPRENIKQIMSEGDDDIISPPRKSDEE